MMGKAFFTTRLLPDIFQDYPQNLVKQACEKQRLTRIDKTEKCLIMLENKAFLYLSAL